jgi:polysaccharide pyruvyl transferase WcaK-like protein
MRTVKFSRTSKINIGDFAISECIEYLHERSGKGTMTSYDLLDEDFDVQTRIASADPEKTYPVKRRGKTSAFAVLTLKRLLFMLRERKQFQARLQHADALVIGGGNILAEVNGGDMFVRCYALYKMAKRKGIPVYVYGVGVGPFDFGFKSRLKDFIKGSAKFLVRDHRAYAFCEQLNAPQLLEKVQVAVDPAFVISDMYPPLETQKKFIGVNFMNFAKLVPNSGFNFDTVAENLISLSQNLNAPIKIINTSFGEDLSIALNIQKRLATAGIVCEIANIDSLDKLPGIFGDLKFFVASRMHSSIFAMAYKVPTFIYPWHHKVDGLCTHLFGSDKGHVLLSQARFDPQEIQQKIEAYAASIDISKVIDDQKAAIYQEYDQLFK